MSHAIENNAFPSAIENKLRRIRWRQIGLAVLRAAGIGVAVLIAAMLVAMLVDWWFTLVHIGVRSILSAVSLSLAAVALLVTGLRPVIHAFSWTQAATQADTEVEQLEERWTTVSHCARTRSEAPSSLSAAMLRQVTSEAVALGALVEPARVVPARRLRGVLAAVVVCASALVVVLALDWEQNSILLRRFWAPTAPITATHLESLTGDATIPRGQPLNIVTRMSGLQRQAATLFLIADAGEPSTIAVACNLDAEGRFAHPVDVDESFRYRVRAGDAQTPWYSVTAVDPPEIAEVQFTITAPDYIDRSPYTRDLLPGRVKAIQGSHLALLMRPRAGLDRCELLLNSHEDTDTTPVRAVELAVDSEGWYRFETWLTEDLSLTPVLYSPFGLTNDDRRVCRIRVIRDTAPVARIIHPVDEMAVGPDEVIDIRFEAHDDHGIAKAELIVYQDFESGERELLSVQEISLAEQHLEKHVLATARLDLAALEVEVGTNVSYAIRVTDSRSLNPQSGDEHPIRGRSPAEGDQENSFPAKAVPHPSQQLADQGGPTGSPDDVPRSDQPGSTGSPVPESAEPSSSARNDDSKSGDTDRTTQEQHASQTDSDASVGAATPGASPEDRKAGTSEIGAQARPVGEADGPNEPETEKQLQRPAPKPVVAEQRGSTRSAPKLTNDQKPLRVTENVETGNAATTPPKTEGLSPAVAAAQTPPETLGARASVARDPQMQRSPEAVDSPPLESPSGLPQKPQDATARPAATETANRNRESSPSSIQFSEGRGSSSASMPSIDLDRQLKFEVQQGQDAESNRVRLKITDRIAVATEAGLARRSVTANMRELLERIDRRLEAAESILLELNQQIIPRELPEKVRKADAELRKSEQIVADLRRDSKETKYEFVGLQMLGIARMHVTPARDHVFVVIQDPGANPARSILSALHHATSAREEIEALTRKFEEVARERELAESLEEVAEIYEVYVENMQGVLREIRQNRNPLNRKMAVIEVDEAYLARYAEVLEMRRELMAEFARILGDDPRLMGKYMDLIKRRSNNLRSQLTELRERQEDVAIELSGWLRVDDAQRPDVWVQVAEMRLLSAKQLAQNASQLDTRVLSQLPLSLEPDAGTAGRVAELARQVALRVRESSLTAHQLLNDALQNEQAKADLLTLATQLVDDLAEFDAELERMAFEHEQDEEINDYVTKRLAESRVILEQAMAWVVVAGHIRRQRYSGLIAVDQDALLTETDRLRISMSSIENDLSGLFQPDDVPDAVVLLVRELLIVMEAITFHQAAATFELNSDRLEKAEAQQTLAKEAFLQAEALFDKMRRVVADVLDEREVDNPNIADLEDPTLDAFLEQLEREPDLNQLLGIPDRPRNLRVIRDWMLWETEGGAAEGASAEQAAANALLRARQTARRSPSEEATQGKTAPAADLSEEEMRRFAEAEHDEKEMEEILAAIQEKIKDPATGAEHRGRLQKQAEMLAQLLQEAGSGNLNLRKWQEVAQADEVRAMLEALARGEPVPDSQWNRVLSTLDSGLWQVRGRTPPEDYRRAIEHYQDQLRQLLRN